MKLTFTLQEDGSITLAPKAAPVTPALSQAYLEYYLREHHSLTVQQWLSYFAKPGEVISLLQCLLHKKPDLDAVIDAIRETVDTRGTCKRKLEALAE
jgi:hypothetical protein